jgi:hypothetical protein
MPEASRPSPSDRSVSRNLFLDADPDLDALAQATADGRARTAGGGQRRRGRGLGVLAEQDRLPEGMRAHDAERFTRANGNGTRLRGRLDMRSGGRTRPPDDFSAAWPPRRIAPW